MISIASPLLVFFLALIFSLGITLGWPNHIALSFFYIAVVFIVAVNLIFSSHKKLKFVTLSLVLLLVFLNHVGIFLGFILASGPDYMLWPDDAIDHHLPNSTDVSRWILGDGAIEIFTDNPFSKIYVSNMWVGLFFATLGIYPIVSAIAMLVIKLFTIYLIYSSAIILTKNKFIALTSSIIYGLLPTITFYTIQFYKDYFIHFLVALILFIFSKSINRPKLVILMALPLSILFIERFYLLLIICAALVLYYWGQSGKIFQKILILTLGILVSFVVFGYYFSGQGVIELIESIQAFESAQNQSIDVTPTTNIALDLFRITFTPFFNLYKLDQYERYDSLLTFGGFVHQLIMLFYLKGLWVLRKNRIVLLNFSFLFLLIILALIMPYNGRARDSLYPLVSIFASVGINSLLNRKKFELV